MSPFAHTLELCSLYKYVCSHALCVRQQIVCVQTNVKEHFSQIVEFKGVFLGEIYENQAVYI